MQLDARHPAVLDTKTLHEKFLVKLMNYLVSICTLVSEECELRTTIIDTQIETSFDTCPD